MTIRFLTSGESLKHSKKGILITATDTGAGKTVITALLGLYLKAKGYETGVLKPVETGCNEVDGALSPEDGEFLRSYIHPERSVEEITPFRFKLPLAPSVAASMEGNNLDYSQVVSFCNEQIDSHDITLIEGVGGLLVPLTREKMVINLAVDLDIPLLIVSPDRLGTLNHTLLTVKVAQNVGLKVCGVILNEVSSVSDISRESNLDELRRLLVGIPVVKVPFIEGEFSLEKLLNLSGEIRWEPIFKRL